MPVRTHPLARRLHEAMMTGELIDPLTEDRPSLSMDEAYAIQDDVVKLLRNDGRRVVGAKLALTSRARQLDLGLNEPLYGWLTDVMALRPGEVLNVGARVHPRAEPEIVFVLGEDLGGTHATAAQVLAATRGVAPAIEVQDSRYREYRFKLPDLIADNASAARFVVGGQLTSPDALDLGLVGCVFEHNGEPVHTAAGAAALGHPASAVAWLVRRLAARGRSLRAGQIIFSGGLTATIPVASGDVVTARFDRLGSVELACR